MSWRQLTRWKSWRRWKDSQGPGVLNEDTWEVVRLTDYAELPGGYGLLKRHHLPGSTQAI